MIENGWNIDLIPDLSGKVAIVTGANTGIGYHTAKEFARKGAITILACRNAKKAHEALHFIEKEIPQAIIKFIYIDLGSLESVHRFTEIFEKKYSQLDILVNNAGVIVQPYKKTADGFESHMGINHLSHFALTGLLSGKLINTAGARVVNVSSLWYTKGNMDFDNFLFENGNGFSRPAAYCRSKLANLMFTYELDRRFKKHSIDAISLAAHPGFAYTDLGRRRFFRALKYPLYPVIRAVTQTPHMGALPTLRAAIDPNVVGSEFFGPGGRKERKGPPVLVSSNGISHSEDDARMLWEISEKLTGVRYLP